MENLSFSIITVCYNSEKTISATIDSVRNQTYKNYEHIIVDGASVDNTLNIIREYKNSSDKVKIISEPDKGIYNAMNKGIMLAEGDLIVFLNSDDTFERNALRIVSEVYTNDIDLVYGDEYMIEEYKGRKFEKKLMINHETVIKERAMLPHNATFIKTNIMKENLFDESLRICSDYKFFLNMYIQERKIKHIPYRITNMGMGGISTTNLILGLKEHISCQEDVLGYSTIDERKRKEQIKRMIFIKRITKILLFSTLYIRLRFLSKGWKEIN